ncbi:hypothetical protein QJS66_14840 [Kocuria rhizophila]|nr:hypothetical protein QJS66_14840 [Kocuria rhizophila]
MMWQGAGVVRTEVGLAETQRALDGGSRRRRRRGPSGRGDLAEHEDRNLLPWHAMLRAARSGIESCGAHRPRRRSGTPLVPSDPPA